MGWWVEVIGQGWIGIGWWDKVWRRGKVDLSKLLMWVDAYGIGKGEAGTWSSHLYFFHYLLQCSFTTFTNKQYIILSLSFRYTRKPSTTEKPQPRMTQLPQTPQKTNLRNPQLRTPCYTNQCTATRERQSSPNWNPNTSPTQPKCSMQLPSHTIHTSYILAHWRLMVNRQLTVMLPWERGMV